MYQQVRIPVNDVPHAQLFPYFDKVADLIEKRTMKGERCLVHCVAEFRDLLHSALHI